ncbi:acyltransferase [Paracoccus aminophilus]|uniref:Acetyltransferase n=1 Tax=Paracoccus aminophilus JCM 7686 TaxID=1367847 RepID=S5Y1F8_PARAH|nr:acyltransferase [Paracoccus aminophilus]AGT11327.1 acetyltransferase [Paracoccus aminophilus JCM 7686]
MLYWPRFRFRRGRIVIGDRVSMRSGVMIDAQSGVVEIGDNVSLNDHVVLLGHGGIRIGNDVRIAAASTLVSFDHGFDDPGELIRKQPLRKAAVVIEDDVWIGAGARILAGSHIARGCVIGAGAVLKGATEPYGIYAGAPARLIRKRGERRGQPPDQSGNPV